MDKKYLGYARVSTDDQIDNYSIDSQRDSIKSYAELFQLELEKIHVDDGYSAYTLDRPEIQKVIEKLETRQYAGVIMYKLDRISRNLKDILILHDDIFKKYDVNMISIYEKFDTSSPTGKLMFSMIGGFAEFERSLIRDRTVLGRYEKAKQGGYSGGRVCYGYDVSDKELIINDYEADIVRKIFELNDIEKFSLNKIANWLNENKIPNKRNGSLWTKIHVRNILNRRSFYHGEYKYKNITSIGLHKNIL